MPVPSVSDVLSIPTRWGGVTNGANSIAQYLASQQQRKNELQYNLANQLINAQALRMGYGGGQSPEIASMLNQNPYGKGLFPNTPQSNPDQGGGNQASMPSTFNANNMFGGLGGSLGSGVQSPAPSFGGGNPSVGGQFNPVTSAGQPNSVATSATMEYKPFVGMVPSKIDVANPMGQAKLASVKGAAEDVTKEGVAQDSAFMQVGNSVRNIISDLKSAQTQSGGSGRIPGMIGSLAEAVGAPDTGNIGAYDAAKTEGAINLARIASGGSRGISTIFQKFEHGFPELSDPDQTQMTKAGTLFRTALSFRRAADSLREKYTEDQLDAMSPTKLEKLLDQQRNEISPDDQKQINDYIGGMIKNTQASPTFSSQGQVATQMNPISRAVAGSPFGKNLGFGNQQSSIPNGRITVVSPDGKIGHIPQEQLEEAIKSGYKKAQ